MNHRHGCVVTKGEARREAMRRLGVVFLLAALVACVVGGAAGDAQISSVERTAEPDVITILTPIALAYIADQNQLKDVEIVGWETDRVPSTGMAVYRFYAAQPGHANGPVYSVVLDERGSVVDLGALEGHERTALFVPDLSPVVFALPALAESAALGRSVSISPSTNDLYLAAGETYSEDIHVIVPPGPPQDVDVYFLADTTGSMGNVLAAVQAGAVAMLNGLLGPSIAFGVGNYKDFPYDSTDNPYCFDHQLDPTQNTSAVLSAIGAWAAGGGVDGSEGQLYALHQLAMDPSIGWRPGAKRVVVWFGDWPGHDPICSAISGTINLDELFVTNELLSSGGVGIVVLAISTTTGCAGGLDGDPSSDAGDYSGICSIDGMAGQAGRIAAGAAPGGSHVTGIDPNSICTTIVQMVQAALSFNNINLSPSGGTAPYVTSITPAGGYGPVSGTESHDYVFHVTFTAPPCENTDQVYTGTIDVVGDGIVVAQKSVTLTVPACACWSYGIKMICGYAKEMEPGFAVLRPGIYATEVNILNHENRAVTVHKYLYPLVYQGEVLGREPRMVGRRAQDVITLPPYTATLDDCWRMCQLLPGSCTALAVYYLELVSPVELTVTAVYTSTNLLGDALTLEVEEIQGTQIGTCCSGCR
jgi:hypothetical protein